MDSVCGLIVAMPVCLSSTLKSKYFQKRYATKDNASRKAQLNDQERQMKPVCNHGNSIHCINLEASQSEIRKLTAEISCSIIPQLTNLDFCHEIHHLEHRNIAFLVSKLHRAAGLSNGGEGRQDIICNRYYDLLTIQLDWDHSDYSPCNRGPKNSIEMKVDLMNHHRPAAQTQLIVASKSIKKTNNKLAIFLYSPNWTRLQTPAMDLFDRTSEDNFTDERGVDVQRNPSLVMTIHLSVQSPQLSTIQIAFMEASGVTERQITWAKSRLPCYQDKSATISSSHQLCMFSAVAGFIVATSTHANKIIMGTSKALFICGHVGGKNQVWSYQSFQSALEECREHFSSCSPDSSWQNRHLQECSLPTVADNSSLNDNILGNQYMVIDILVNRLQDDGSHAIYDLLAETSNVPFIFHIRTVRKLIHRSIKVYTDQRNQSGVCHSECGSFSYLLLNVFWCWILCVEMKPTDLKITNELLSILEISSNHVRLVEQAYKNRSLMELNQYYVTRSSILLLDNTLPATNHDEEKTALLHEIHSNVDEASPSLFSIQAANEQILTVNHYGEQRVGNRHLRKYKRSRQEQTPTNYSQGSGLNEIKDKNSSHQVSVSPNNGLSNNHGDTNIAKKRRRSCVYIILFFYLQIVSCVANPCEVFVRFKLKTARCDKLGLTAVPNDLPIDVKVLSFIANKLEHLGDNMFSTYVSLQEIYIPKNMLQSVSPKAFSELKNLQILHVDSNKLRTIPSSSFQHLRSVRILNMDGNLIKFIDANAFTYLENIEEISLANCHIERIDPKAFHGLKKLTGINLVNNQLKSLSSKMKNFLPPELNILRLYQNPWNCDCELRWLREWLAHESRVQLNWDFRTKTPTCDTPEIIKGIDWKHMDPDRFACPSHIHANSTTTTMLVPGSNHTIECIISGSPVPRVSWQKNNKGLTPDYDKFIISTIGGMDDYQIRSYLTIRHLTAVDAGDYKCIASNPAGQSEVTFKLWMQTKTAQSKSGSSLSQETILGVAVGGALILLVLVIIVVYGLRRRDQQHHEYKVRERKALVQNHNSVDVDDKLIPNATTQLLGNNHSSSNQAENRQNHIKAKEKHLAQEREKDLTTKKQQSKPNDIASKGEANKDDLPMKDLAKNINKPTANNTSKRESDEVQIHITNKKRPNDIKHNDIKHKENDKSLQSTPDLLKTDKDHKKILLNEVLPNGGSKNKNEQNKCGQDSSNSNHVPKTTNHAPKPAVTDKQASAVRTKQVSLYDNPVSLQAKQKVHRAPSLEKDKTSKAAQNEASNRAQRREIPNPPPPARSNGLSSRPSKDDLLRQNSLSKDSLSNVPVSNMRISPTRTPTTSRPAIVADGPPARMPGQNLPLTNHARGGVSREVSLETYQTLQPKRSRPQYPADGAATMRPNRSHNAAEIRPAAQAGVLSPQYQTLPNRGRNATKQRVPIKPCITPVITKDGKTIMIPPPPAPPGGRFALPTDTDYRPKPKTAHPDGRERARGKPGSSPSSMYDFPSGSNDWTGEKEKMPRPGTRTEFGTAV